MLLYILIYSYIFVYIRISSYIFFYILILIYYHISSYFISYINLISHILYVIYCISHFISYRIVTWHHITSYHIINHIMFCIVMLVRYLMLWSSWQSRLCFQSQFEGIIQLSGYWSEGTFTFAVVHQARDGHWSQCCTHTADCIGLSWCHGCPALTTTDSSMISVFFWFPMDGQHELFTFSICKLWERLKSSSVLQLTDKWLNLRSWIWKLLILTVEGKVDVSLSIDCKLRRSWGSFRTSLFTMWIASYPYNLYLGIKKTRKDTRSCMFDIFECNAT